jgi:hypothetical protein
MNTRYIASIGFFLVVLGMLLLTQVFAAQRAAEHSPPTLIVTPSTSTVAHRISHKGINGHRQILDQDSVLVISPR